MPDQTAHTQSSLSSPSASPATAVSPYLFLVVAAHRPLLAPARHSLADIDVVTIRRGERRIERRIAGGERHLVLHIPDPWISETHASLVKTLGAWTLRDTGSRNGTLCNGTRTQQALLADGDVLEMGHTFFLYRAAQPVDPAGPPDVLAPSPGSYVPGLSTLLPSLAREFATLSMIAESPLSVVIQGESGTGKELIARAVHALSRRKGPLVEVNCGALPATLLESELFGFRRGAFSGAVDDRPGLIRSADRGTLFLDEIGDLPLSSQVAFLRVLEERHVVPLGGTKPIPVDLRLCAATHRDLEQLTREGGFRADLLARLAGHSLRLPPLRERREDFGILIGDLLLRIAGERAARLEFSRDTLRALLCRPWPLNVRELAKSLEHAVVLAHEQPIRPEHLPETLRLVQAVPTKAAESPDAVPSKDTESPRRDQLLDLLAKHQGNVSAIARILGKQRSQIRRWLKRYGLDSDKFRPPI